MIILYYCHTGVHSALVGAGIHLGLLPSDSAGVEKEDICRLPRFNGISHGEVGTPFYIGKDESGNDVYVFGVNHEPLVFEKAVKNLLDLHHISPSAYKVVNILQCNNRWISMGGWFTIIPGWNHLGRAMAVHGLLRAYDDIAAVVSEVKRGLH